MIKKVVVIGPESTGKSMLCKQLAAHFKTEWVPEYARTFLEEHGTKYNFDDLFKIATGQLAQEDNIVASIQETQSVVFIDTDMYVMKVWSEFVFNTCDNRILTQIAKRKYDLYLLCNTDVAWVKDELREYPDLVTREKLFHYYKEAMINQHVPWVEIAGDYEERLNTAIAAVSKLL
jgi:NadR type nicotinamide-nucleotide adenylyltransferase